MKQKSQAPKPQHWLVVGAGVSGYGAAALLRSMGHHVAVSDKRRLSEAEAQRYKDLGASVCEGEQSASHLDNREHLVVSPGIPHSIPLLQEAKRRGITIHSEIALALAHFHGKVIGVTGTNGKSTTCVMLEHLFRRLGDQVKAGGNLGDPPSLMVATKTAPATLILELSSYQIETTPDIKVQAAAFTSFSFDHIERHGSLEAYFAAKWRLITQVSEGAPVVMPLGVYKAARSFGFSLPPQAMATLLLGENDCPLSTDGHRWLRLSAEHTLTDAEGKTLCDFKTTSLSSGHNRLNATMCLAIATHFYPHTWPDMLAMLDDFSPLPFRCERVGHHQNYAIINDSKSTNVESTLAALSSEGAPFILMMGGQGKGEPYAPILAKRERIKRLVCFGATGQTIHQELAPSLPSQCFPTLAEAMHALPALFAETPATLLFSPGCASFDEFKNYMHRGSFFTEQARSLFNLG